ncbi:MULTISPECIES: hypothetical protein [Sphingomonas]|uniref:Uncharacterized protein n=2 Tax=Sphingomonas TaxID=13687 RepID=A0A7W9EZY5_9SPHN|nr:hypothetical protein [Sphingomonas prati]MBB5727756.1 hypothetical protein [Sphingomonas prati]GGE80457.1 hypothetical protein GCM10011404_11480 [Sphingomonas prati]
MTGRPDGAPGRGARILYAVVVGVLLLTIAVAVFAYIESHPAPERGSAQLPAQAAEGSGLPAR